MKQSLFILVLVLVLASACSKDNSPSPSPAVPCNGVTVTFTEANAVIQGSCTTSGCHNSGSRNGPGALLSYSQIYNARTSIRSSVANGSMPQGSHLTTEEKNKIVCWIENGAQNN